MRSGWKIATWIETLALATLWCWKAVISCWLQLSAGVIHQIKEWFSAANSYLLTQPSPSRTATCGTDSMRVITSAHAHHAAAVKTAFVCCYWCSWITPIVWGEWLYCVCGYLPEFVSQPASQCVLTFDILPVKGNACLSHYELLKQCENHFCVI